MTRRRRSNRPRRTALVVLVSSAALAGCADRGLITRPSTAPSGFAWLSVWVALALVTLVSGLLLTLPVWRTWRGSRLAVGVFTLEAGASVVAGVVLASIAVRSRQILGRPGGAPPDDALLRLSGADGDRAFFAIMFLAAIALAIALAALAAAGARLAGSAEPLERATASGILAIEAGVGAYAIVRLVLGASGLPYVIPAFAFPIVVAAFVTCWPKVASPEYNSGHG